LASHPFVLSLSKDAVRLGVARAFLCDDTPAQREREEGGLTF